MGFFDRRRQKKLDVERLRSRLAQEPPIQVLPGYPETWQPQLGAAVEATDITAVVRLYEDLDVLGRVCFLDDFGDFFYLTEPRGRTLAEAWIAALEPLETPYAQMLLAVIHRAFAWSAHGEDASEITKEGVTSFNEQMVHAVELLIEAGLQLKYADIVPFIVAQTCSHPLSGEDKFGVAAYWQAIDPFDRLGLLELGKVLDERWSGDPEAQLALVEYVAKNAPEGHDGLAAVPELVTQRWEYLACFKELSFGECDERTVENDRVLDLIKLAYRKLFVPGLEIDSRLEARHLNFFAWCCYFGEANELAYQMISRLHGRVYPEPWMLRAGDDETADEAEAIEEYQNARDDLIEQIEFAEW